MNMLRISSILYLQHVWTRPIEPVKDDDNTSNQNEQDNTISEVEEDLIVIETEQQETTKLVEELSIKKPKNSIQSENIIYQESANEKVTSHHVAYSSDSHSSICTGNTSILFSRSETPVTHHEETSNQTTPILTASTIDREYYDDDVILSEDEDEDQLHDPVELNKKKSSKFSPKRMLQRAKSSITEESVRRLGRKTSLLLNSLHQQPSTASLLTPNKILVQHDNQPQSTLPVINSPLKGLRRQSSKLTVKGKTLTKKLKRAMSFHQQATVV